MLHFTSIRQAFGRGSDARRFQLLLRELEQIGGDIRREVEAVTASKEKVAACAAFAFEAMENGGSRARLSPKIDALTASMASHSDRIALLEMQRAFVENSKSALAEILASMVPPRSRPVGYRASPAIPDCPRKLPTPP